MTLQDAIKLMEEQNKIELTKTICPECHGRGVIRKPLDPAPAEWRPVTDDPPQIESIRAADFYCCRCKGTGYIEGRAA